MRKTIFFILIGLLLTGCGLKPYEEEPELEIPQETTIAEASSLFNADESNKQIKFETNEEKYLTAKGYTLWSSTKVNTSDSFEPISVTTIKESGRSEAGFGIVFCSNTTEEKSFMLTVLINTAGFYTIGKITNGVFCHINDGWKSSSFINKGYGIENKLDVSYDADKKIFNLKINDYDVTTFTVSDTFVFKDSKSGYAVVIAANESFPNNPVKVSFQE